MLMSVVLNLISVILKQQLVTITLKILLDMNAHAKLDTKKLITRTTSVLILTNVMKEVTHVNLTMDLAKILLEALTAFAMKDMKCRKMERVQK